MNSKAQRVINTQQKEDGSESIAVGMVGISIDDASKLRKIFQLSSTRKRRYVENAADSEKMAQIIISGDLEITVKEHQVLVVYGKNSSNSSFHIQPPLMSLRVLRMLDGIELKKPKNLSVINTPRKIERVKVLDKNAANETETQGKKNSSYRVLIVDDSLLIHKALKIELNKASFKTQNDYTESGEDCLKLISENQYDMIFLDIMMPGIDGFKTCTEIRKVASYKKVPVIMLSAKTSPVDEVKGVMAGCTSYLTKPINHEDFKRLLGRMDSWMKKCKTS
jgi:twitching motility two-component system response regulator PilG